jgi:hypothetical protein
MSKSTVSKDVNQLSFSDLGVLEAAPFPAQATPRKRKVAQKVTTPDNAVSHEKKNAFSELLSKTELLAVALQEKYDANLTAHRVQSRVGISVDVEDIEALLLAISNANNVLHNAN